MFEILSKIATNPTVQIIWGILLPTIVGVYIKMLMSYKNAKSFFGVGGTGAWIAELTPTGTEYCKVLDVGFTFIKLQCLDGVKYVHTISFKKRPWKFLNALSIISAKQAFLEQSKEIRKINLSGDDKLTQKEIQETIDQLKNIFDVKNN